MDKQFTNLYGEMPNVYFSKKFLTWGKELKLVTSQGEIYPDKGSFTFYRYMQLKHFNEMISNNNIIFISPYLWHDPFEFLFYQPNIKIRKNDSVYYQTYALCFTIDTTNEETKWQNSGCNTQSNYQNDDRQIIRVKFNLRELCRALSKNNSESLIFVSHIDYSHKKKEIVSILNRLSKKNSPKYTDIEQYVYNLTLKRKAFTYENEVRIFVIDKTENKKNFERIKPYRIDISSKIIPQITLPPKPLEAFDPQNEKSVDNYKNILKNYKDIYFNEVDSLKQKLEKSLKGLSVKRSVLYNIGSEDAINLISL